MITSNSHASDELRSLLLYKEEQHPSKERGHPLRPFVFASEEILQVQMLFLELPNQLRLGNDTFRKQGSP